MIVKASQRALGQDLATHLLNALDNEYVEVAELRGTVARDLHGAFAEWEACASAMTRCKNYLYSLSVNPDPTQGPLTREQYYAFIDRAEERLGLAGQGRIVTFHIKDGREHCHVVWSRIDMVKGKAIHQAFDHEKLMLVARQFAREQGLELPDGMQPGADRDSKSRKRSLYERHQETATGLTKEERMAHITQAWRQSDSPRAFVRSLEQLGYVLATGRRDYVLVDVYGNMNSLPKLIDDRQVRTKDVRAFLGDEFPPESLPSVDEAKELVAQHRKAIDDFQRAQTDASERAALLDKQAARRREAQGEHADMVARQRREAGALDQRHASERRALRSAYLEQARQIRRVRNENRPTGLAAFLGRVSGVQFVIHRVQKYQDHKRHAAYLDRRDELRGSQKREQGDLKHRHQLQALDQQRKVRAAEQVDARELHSLAAAQLRAQRLRECARHEHMPALTLELKPPGRRAAIYKAKHRYTRPPRANETPSEDERQPSRPVDLSSEFKRAADKGKKGGREERGETGGGLTPEPIPRVRPSRHRRRDRDIDRGR